MIDDSKHTFRVVPRQRVTRVRGHLQDDDRSREHDCTDNIADVTAFERLTERGMELPTKAAEAADRASPAIRDFFSERRLPRLEVGTPSPIASDLRGRTLNAALQPRRSQADATQAEYVFGLHLLEHRPGLDGLFFRRPRSAPPGVAHEIDVSPMRSSSSPKRSVDWFEANILKHQVPY